MSFFSASRLSLCLIGIALSLTAYAGEMQPDSLDTAPKEIQTVQYVENGEGFTLDPCPAPELATGAGDIIQAARKLPRAMRPDIYDFPYSATRSIPDWRKLWVNTAVLMGGGITALGVLELLPSDATAWNKKENAKIPLFKRYWRNVRQGPVWDHDNPVFNLILHPYGGAAYYMSARSAGFNIWGSFLYSFAISTGFWEYGFEAFNEIPSVQDLIVTPVTGAVVGEGFYVLKRKILERDYRVLGSKAVGYFLAFLLDPVNEACGYFTGYQKHRADHLRAPEIKSAPWLASDAGGGVSAGLSVAVNF